MAGLDPAIPLSRARSCRVYRDRRVKPGDDGDEGQVHLIIRTWLQAPQPR
jgi:hypothetical protein